MARIRQTKGDERTPQQWIVATQYDGRVLAGPFDKRGEAIDAMDTVIPAVVRTAPRGGFNVVDEDTGKHLAGPFRDANEAKAEALNISKPVKQETEVQGSDVDGLPEDTTETKPKKGRPRKQ